MRYPALHVESINALSLLSKVFLFTGGSDLIPGEANFRERYPTDEALRLADISQCPSHLVRLCRTYTFSSFIRHFYHL